MSNFLKPRTNWKNICILEGIIILILVIILCFKSSATEFKYSYSDTHSVMNSYQFDNFIKLHQKCDSYSFGNGLYLIHTYTEPAIFIRGLKIDYNLIMNYIPTNPDEIMNSIKYHYGYNGSDIFNIINIDGTYNVNYINYY